MTTSGDCALFGFAPVTVLEVLAVTAAGFQDVLHPHPLFIPDFYNLGKHSCAFNHLLS
jgi:hypothetical protein